MSVSGGCYKDHPKLGGLKIAEMLSSHSTGGQNSQVSTTGLKSRYQQGNVPSEVPKETLSLASSAAYGGCWRSVSYGCITPVSASAVTLPPSLCLYENPLCLSLTRTMTMAFRAHPVIQDHLPISRSLSLPHLQRLFLHL